MKKILFLLLSASGLLHHGIYAQSNMWPSYFSIPDTVQSETDTFSLSIYNKASYSYNERFKDNAVVKLSQLKNGVKLEQQAEYVIDDYDNTTRDHYVDLSGEILRPFNVLPRTGIGLQWSPIIKYKERPENRRFQSYFDFGPMLKSEIIPIPVMVKAGFSGVGWLDSTKQGIFSTPLRSYHGAPGVYAGFNLGDYATGIGQIPLFFDLNAYGKSIRNAGSALILGRALYVHSFKNNDSLFFYVADSLQNGKEIYFDKMQNETPWRINNSFNSFLGFKARERIGLVPAMYYNFKTGSIEYPADSVHYNDVRTWTHLVNIQLRTSDVYFFDYSGGLSIGREHEDWVFRTDVDRSKRFLDPADVIARRNDHYSNIAISDHVLRVNLPRNFALEYEFHASKDSKVYDTLFTRDSVINNTQESDQIRIVHHGGVMLDTSRGFFLKLYGEYSNSYLYYLHKSMSQLSKQDVNYRIGAEFNYANNCIRVIEKIFMDARVSEYVFKFPSNPPPYFRNVSSMLSCYWTVNNKLEVAGTWTGGYSDDGYWYGTEYLDSLSENHTDYYAINSKFKDNTVMLQVKLFFNWINIVASTSFRGTNSRNYNFKTDSYISEMGDVYSINPSLEVTILNDYFNIEGKVKRYFTTTDQNRWGLRKNWDLSLTAKVEF